MEALVKIEKHVSKKTEKCFEVVVLELPNGQKVWASFDRNVINQIKVAMMEE